MNEKEDDALPDFASLTKKLLDDLAAAKRETAVDWSDVPLWKVLATTSENPYGVKSKAGLRRLERQAKKRALHKRPKGRNLDGSKRKKRKRAVGRPRKRKLNKEKTNG